MCGIAGFFNPSLKQVDGAILQEFGEVQHHRGPDYFGYRYYGHAGMAHNRLSIIDLSENGNQPFENERYSLVYNGEIYNYLEIREALLGMGIRFKSSSDTEVLFHSLIQFGLEKTLEKIRGMFAFAFLDRQRNRLSLARDRIGIKPLFYIQHGGTVYFASELKGLWKVLPLEVDRAACLFSTMGILEKARRLTMFRNVYHVEPGTSVSWGQGEDTAVTVYFKLSDFIDESYYRELSRLDSREVFSEFRRLFDASVKKMLMSDAPMGTFVSGGIDSSVIALYAGGYNPGLSLFTANVTGIYSEFPDATALSKSIGLPLYDYKFEPEMILRDWARVTYFYESPLVTHQSAIPFANVTQLAREKNVKAVLTGEGSDELFLGYPKLLTSRYEAMLRLPYTLLNRIYAMIPGLSDYIMNVRDDALSSTLALSVQGFERQIIRREAYNKMDFLDGKNREDQYQSLLMLNESIVSLLWRNDRMGMLASIEARFPYLDEEVLKFGINLPFKKKYIRSRRFHNIKHPFLIDKYLVRMLGQGRLPEHLVYKKKNAFPLYGFRHLQTRPEYFRGGFLQDFLGLDNEAAEFLGGRTEPYLLTKFLALDIWGKIFVKKEPLETVTESLQQHVSISI